MPDGVIPGGPSFLGTPAAPVIGWGAATGGSKVAFNGATATLPQTSAALAQLIADLTTHGLIGT